MKILCIIDMKSCFYILEGGVTLIKKIMVFFISILALVAVVAVVGSVLLEEFPSLQVAWEEIKRLANELYSYSIVKYGTLVTVIIIFALAILVGSSN